MSKKVRFIDMLCEWVDPIDKFYKYVDETSFYRHIRSIGRLRRLIRDPVTILMGVGLLRHRDRPSQAAYAERILDPLGERL